MNVPPYGNEFKKALANFAVLKPSAQDNPDMTIKVSAGGAWVFTSSGSIYSQWAGGSSPAITAPSVNPKWVIVALTSTNTLVLIEGAEAASPVLPNLAAHRIPIAFIYLQTTTTKIMDDMIFDARFLFSSFPYVHADLQGRSVSDAHPTSAITGLDNALSDLINTSALTAALATKADTTGTIEPTFVLNSDATGSPSADVTFSVERGSSANVGIKWNETLDIWEATLNGTDWFKLVLEEQEFTPKLYEAATEPVLAADGKIAFWKDTDDSNKIYLIFRRGSGDQVKIQLT